VSAAKYTRAVDSDGSLVCQYCNGPLIGKRWVQLGIIKMCDSEGYWRTKQFAFHAEIVHDEQDEEPAEDDQEPEEGEEDIDEIPIVYYFDGELAGPVLHLDSCLTQWIEYELIETQVLVRNKKKASDGNQEYGPPDK
jgi:hypothetical protein